MLKEKANRSCRFCKKLFCCMECRDRHVNKVHTEVTSNCPLCASEIFLLRQLQKLTLEDEKLLLHITDKHLPLNCILCGDQFKTADNFKSFDTCRWYARPLQLMTSKYFSLPITPTGPDEQLQKCSISNVNCNDNTHMFCTPPEIYRNTSTPMLLAEKIEFEFQTPLISSFTLKTPETNSPSHNSQILKTHELQDSNCSTKFFSFSLYTTPALDITPFRRNKKEFAKNNSDKKLDIMEKQNTIPNNETKKMIKNGLEIESISDMELTDVEGGILNDSTKSKVIHEKPNRSSDIVKKVRFSDQYKDQEEGFRNQIESCEEIISDTTQKEFYDIKNDTSLTENKHITNTKDDTLDVIGTQKTNNSQVKDEEISPDDIRILKISSNKMGDTQKKNKESKSVKNSLTVTNQQDTSEIVMMILVRNKSKQLTDDLLPLISAGLKKLEEKTVAMNTDQTSMDIIQRSNIPDSSGYKRSVTKIEMNVSKVESYSTNSVNTVTSQRNVLSSTYSMQKNENVHSKGFLSSITEAVKCFLRSFSNSVMPGTIPGTSSRQWQQINDQSQFLPGSSNGNCLKDAEVRPIRKRSRDTTDTLSTEDSATSAIDVRSPLAKRHRTWCMVKGREPLKRMRDVPPTSPRGVSSETQVFSQGSLTVGDTILPLPVRAHQSTHTEE